MKLLPVQTASSTASELLTKCCAGLYLSILAAICLLAIVVFNVYMAVRLPAQPTVFMPTRSSPQMTPAPVSVRAEARPVPIQPISDNAAEALRKTDENLTKRIIKLATKVRPYCLEFCLQSC